MKRLFILTVTSFFFLNGCEQPAEKESEIAQKATPIVISEAWLRKMPKGFSNTAGFMTIQNNTAKPLILKDVSLDWAKMAMIHETKVVDGVAKMLHQDAIVIEQSLEFKPGGLHIMIMGIKEPLQESKSYNILLHFAEREPLVVPFKLGQAKH